MRFSFLGQLVVLAVAGLGAVACAPAIAQRPVQVMRSEAGVSSCEVITVVRQRMYWTPMELKDPDAMAIKATKSMKEDASRLGANYLHVDSMDVPNNEAAATAYSCPSTFKADLRSADVAFINFDGTKRTMNLPAEAPVVVAVAPPPPPVVVADTTPVSTTTTTSAVTPTSAKSTAKTSPATAAASSTTEAAKPTKKKGAGVAGAGAKKKAATKKAAAKDAAAKDPSMSFSP